MSLVRLGRQPRSDETPAGMLRDCHARIRSFADLAVKLAEEDAAADELRDAARRVHRYFTTALPLHVADEERSVLPRLRRFVPESAERVAVIEAAHRAHDVLLARLIPAWQRLGSELRDRRDTLADASRLRDELEAHLAMEERTLFAALALVPPEEARAIVAEMRQRRE